jgi:hypothetical protein
LRFLARFQRLERARARSTEPPTSEAETERFSALESAAPLPEVRSPPSGRFEPPQPPEAPLELDRGSHAQPFVRCQACGRDSQRGTVLCLCGARLDSGAVAAFNAQLWAELQTQQQDERVQHHQALERDLAEAAQHTVDRRALGEALARRVAEQERLANPPLAPRWSWAIGVGLLGLVLVPIGIRAHSLVIPLLGMVAIAAVGLWLRQRGPPGQ